MKKTFALLFILALTACAKPGPEAYVSRGNPENLLSKNTDLVSVEIGPKDWNYKLRDTVLTDPPVRAKLNCPMSSTMCVQARDILIATRVPFDITGTGQNVELVYERVTAYNCVNRYVNNSSNNRNLNHPAFGCSVTANTVQMVSDKRQFTNPAMLDPIPAR